MTSLTDRYVHAVTTQLPEDQRTDIGRELRATIEDTVVAAPAGTDPVQTERQVLLDLGHPTRLADSYRGQGRALIGPRLYPVWLRTLKALLTWVPLLAAALMVILGVLDGDTPVAILGGAVSALVWSALQVAFWVTLGFAIAERTGADSGAELDALGVDDLDNWDPADLPEPEDRGHVSWGDAFFAVVGNAFLLALLLLPFRFGGRVEGLGQLHLLIEQGPDARVIGGLPGRGHDDGRQEQGQRDEHRVGRALLHAERGAQQRQHHHDAHEAGGHDDDRRRQRQHGHQADQLDHPLGQAGAGAQVDVDGRA